MTRSLIALPRRSFALAPSSVGTPRPHPNPPPMGEGVRDVAPSPTGGRLGWGSRVSTQGIYRVLLRIALWISTAMMLSPVLAQDQGVVLVVDHVGQVTLATPGAPSGNSANFVICFEYTSAL